MLLNDGARTPWGQLIAFQTVTPTPDLRPLGWLHFVRMGGKWLVAGLLGVLAVSGCAPEPPPYTSQYTPPPPIASPPPALAAGASFVDLFDRPNTESGLGGGWDMRESADYSPILPPTTDGLIADGHFVSSGSIPVYAARTFRSVLRRVGAEGRWTRAESNSAGGSDEKLVIAITANDRLKSDLVQLVASPVGWEVATRRNGGTYRREMTGKFDPPLEFNREYRFEMDATNGSVTVRVPGTERKGNVGTAGLLSERGFWELASGKEQPSGKFAYNAVWAGEQDQPMSPLPSPE